MRILALDIATVTGFADGEASCSCPASGSVRLRRGEETVEHAAFNMLAWLRDRWTFASDRPDILFCEAPINPAGHKSADAAMMAMALYFSAAATAKAHRVRIEKAAPSTIRKHFIGQANMSGRDATKRAVAARASALGYLPRGCTDLDRADALAAWDFAAATFARRAPAALVMFGG